MKIQCSKNKRKNEYVLCPKINIQSSFYYLFGDLSIEFVWSLKQILFFEKTVCLVRLVYYFVYFHILVYRLIQITLFEIVKEYAKSQPESSIFYFALNEIKDKLFYTRVKTYFILIDLNKTVDLYINELFSKFTFHNLFLILNFKRTFSNILPFAPSLMFSHIFIVTFESWQGVADS